MGSQECAHRFLRIRGRQLSAYGVIQTLTITNIRIIVQIGSRALSELHSEGMLYFKENFYLCIFRKEYIRYILKKIAFLLLDPSLNSGKIVNTQVTTCMSAYVLRGRDSVVRILAVQKPGGYSVDPSTLSLHTLIQKSG